MSEESNAEYKFYMKLKRSFNYDNYYFGRSFLNSLPN